MTRFARARGSNASNERVPEDATPWNVMRNQLLKRNESAKESDERAKFEDLRQQNYEKFLKERKEKSATKTWCEFEQDESKKGDKKKKMASESGSEMSEDDERLVKWCEEQESDDEYRDLYKDITSKLENIIAKTDSSFLKIEKKSKLKEKKAKHVSEDALQETLEKVAKKTSKKKKRKDLEEIVETTEKNPKKKRHTAIEENTREGTVETAEKMPNKKKRKNVEEIIETADKMPKKKKHKNIEENTREEILETTLDKVSKKKKSKILQNTNDTEVGKFVKNTSISENEEETIRSKRAMKRKLKREAKRKESFENGDRAKPPEPKKLKLSVAENHQNKSQQKLLTEKSRRKPENQNTIIIVDGEKLEVAYYDGFPILAKDAERLKELRKSMIAKSIPKSEVDRTMKLERRRAEKSFARIKRKQCFHCRKAGHNLSECPDLNKASENTGAPSSGICFKCGSTEHTHFNCKVVKNQDYKFAQCFICKEQGHISRQCPDNPRGIYPKGGACKECGDVTHLKKDCPKIVQVREDHSMKLDVMESNNVEEISRKPSKINNHANKVKRVQF